MRSKPRKPPVVLSIEETSAILMQLTGIHRLIVEIMYGSGLRVSEALGIRVQDLGFATNSLTIRNGKGSKDRVTLLSEKLRPEIEAQIETALEVQLEDNKDGTAPSMPNALDRKCPTAFRSLSWMFLFPSISLCHHPVNNRLCRHHLHHTVIRKALKRTVSTANVIKRVTCHTFRHSFMEHFPVFHPSGHPSDVQIFSKKICATHLLQSDTDIRTVQELLGHSDIKVIQIVAPSVLPSATLAHPCTSYTHIIGQHYAGTSGPLDKIKESRAAYVC